MITGDSPIGLPRRFEGKNIDGKKIYYIIIETKAAETAQKIAEKITYLEIRIRILFAINILWLIDSNRCFHRNLYI